LAQALLLAQEEEEQKEEEIRNEATLAMLQEKDDMIEQLQNELENKRSEIAEATRTVADLKEELEILEKK